MASSSHTASPAIATFVLRSESFSLARLESKAPLLTCEFAGGVSSVRFDKTCIEASRFLTSTLTASSAIMLSSAGAETPLRSGQCARQLCGMMCSIERPSCRLPFMLNLSRQTPVLQGSIEACSEVSIHTEGAHGSLLRALCYLESVWYHSTPCPRNMLRTPLR
jgi:hypothetical protein